MDKKQDRVVISVPFLCGLILFLLWDKTGLGAQTVLAAAIHEMGHLAAMVVLGQPLRRLVLTGFGARLEKGAGKPMGYGRQALIYAAGPAANLLMAAVSNGALTRQSHLLLGIFNLLPLSVLDGGQLLRCLLLKSTELSKADRLLKAVFWSVGSFLLVLSVAVVIQSGYNATLLATTAYLLWRLLSGGIEV